jgi:hypothetical protein
VAEETGKGIALVILGIVAIIAIVGLVLLFTGAKKAAGEFAVPAAREYGGAIKGVSYPYARAFPGRAVEVPAYYEDISGLSNEKKGGTVATYGESAKYKAVSSEISANRGAAEIPSHQSAACQLAEECKNAGYCNQAGYVEASQAYGLNNCVSTITKCTYSVEGYPLECHEEDISAIGYCCRFAGLQER